MQPRSVYFNLISISNKVEELFLKYFRVNYDFSPSSMGHFWF